VCETIGQSPEFRAAKDATERDDTGVALDELVANSVRFWAAHERLLEPLLRRRRRRRGRRAPRRPTAPRPYERARPVREAAPSRAPPGPRVGQRRALALLLVLTSFETYLELRRHAGLAEREVVRTLHAWAAAVLLARA